MTVELVAALRGVPTPRIPGLGAPQRLAGALVTALLVGTLPLAASAVQPAAGPLDLAAAVLSTQAAVDDVVDQLDGRTAAPSARSDRVPQAEQPATAELPTVVVQRHDTLWLLAEQHLGSGERFAEIVALNKGARQPDGRALQDEGRLYPGWELRLPEDADLQAPRPARIVVQPGDTLWDIADEELHDPIRFHELVEENQGDLQPDGRRLRDADLIRPGWVIALPSDVPDGGAARGAERGSQQPPGGAARSGAAEGAAAAAALDGRSGTTATMEPAPEEQADPAPAASGKESQPTPTATPGEQGAAAGPPRAVRPSEPDALRRTAEAFPSASQAPQPRSRGSAGSEASAPPASEAGLSSAPAPATPPAGPATAAPPPGPGVAAPGGPIDLATGGGSPPPGAMAPADTEPEAASGGSGLSVDSPFLASDERAGIALPAGGVAAALLVAALAVELIRRRRLFQRWRRPGEFLSKPSARARRLETTMTTGAAARDGALLASALGALGDAYAAAKVRVVEVGPDCVRLSLGQDWGSVEPPEPFHFISPQVLAASREAP